MKNWSTANNSPCAQMKTAKFLRRIHNQLDDIKEKAEKRLDC